MAPSPSVISSRSSIHFSALRNASLRTGRRCTASAQCISRSRTMKKLRQESMALRSMRKRRIELARPPTYNSSIPCSGGSFLNGFLAYMIASGTRIDRDHEEIS